MSKESLLKISVSVVLIVALYFLVDKDAFLTNLTHFDIRYVPPILLLLVLNYTVSSIRWKNLLSIYEGSEKASLSYLISLYFIGSFFNNFMPTSIGGDVYKIIKLGKKIDSKAHAFSATFMERFTGMISLMFIATFGFLVTFARGYAGFEDEFYLLGLIVVGMILVFCFGWVFGFKVLEFLSKRVAKLANIYKSISLYKTEYTVLGVAFVSSFLVQLFSIFTQFYIFAAIGIHLDIFRTLFIFPLIILATFFIPSLNGIGVQDFLYKFSNSFLLIPEPSAVAASFLFHGFKLVVSLFGGVLYALGKSE